MAQASRFALYLLFALSGVCGLIYESIWSHYLRNYLGHAAHGQTVVLVIFVGGLALGAWLAGRKLASLREPLFAYAAAEVFIGLAALVFHPLYVGFTGWTYDTLLPATCAAEGACATQWIASALLIAAPAVALGATFPWMAAGVLRRHPEAPGHEISVLYFVNSLGAVFGVLASAFVLIPTLGLPGTLTLAGIANLAIGAVVAAIAWRRPLSVAAVAVPASGDDGPADVSEGAEAAARKAGKRARAAMRSASRNEVRRGAAVPGEGEVAGRDGRPLTGHAPAELGQSMVLTFLAVAALTGLASFVYEIVWIRMLSLVLGASTHAFELMLAAFILGLALGGAWIRNRIDRIADSRAFLGHVQVWMGLAAVLTLPLYHSLFDLFGFLMGGLARTDPGYLLFQLASASIALAVMLPATFLAGMTLPLITYRLLASGVGERALGSVYAANTVGAILGVIAAVHVLIPWLGLKGALVVGAAIDIGLGIYLLRRPRGELAFSWPGFATVLAGLGVLGVVAAGVTLDPRRMTSGVFRDGNPRLDDRIPVLFHADGKTASVSVIDSGGRRMLRTNGKTDASMALPGQPPTPDEPTQALLGALALGANPQAKRAAVIGIGSGVTTAALLASPTLQRVDTIEIERRMLDGAKLFEERNAVVFSDPRSHFVVDDAKAWLARASAPYDIIVSEPSNPWVSGVASLFTVETYERFARHLAPGGVLVQWIQLYEMDGALLSSMFRALVAHFPHYTVYKGGPGDVLVIASAERRPVVDAAALFAQPALAKLLGSSGVGTPAEVDARWRGDDGTVNALLAGFDAPVNSDYRPFVDVNAARARFVRSSAEGVFDVGPGPLAMLEMLGSAPPRTKAATPLALALADALAAPPEQSPALPPVHADYADALRASRELMRTCKPGAPLGVLLEGAVGTAIAINDGLDRARAAEVWKTVRSGACYKTLPAEVRTWVDLFAAVAARDAAAMADLGTRAVADPPGEFARDYALAAAVIGEIALGRPEVGGRLLESYAPPQPQAWTMALREATARKSIANK